MLSQSDRTVLTPRALLTAAAAVATAFVLLLMAAYTWADARWLDTSALQSFDQLIGARVGDATGSIIVFGDPAQVGVIGCLLAAIALLRSRPRAALLVLVLLAATSVSSQLLKALLAYPRHTDAIDGFHVATAAFPSGHATAAMSLAIALVVVVPRRLRPAAGAIGVAFALGMGVALVSDGWHFPSDVVGGYLLATGWALVLLAALVWADARFPARSVRSRALRDLRTAVEWVTALGLGAILLAGAGVAALLALVALTKLPELIGLVQSQTGFLVVVLGIALSALVLLAGLTGALYRRG